MKKDGKTKDVTRTSLSVRLLLGILFILAGLLCYKCYILENVIKQNRKIYTYNLEEVLSHTNIVTIKQNFEDEMIKLNDELNEGEKKIQSLKKVDVKEDFTDIYLKNLRLKRDDLVADYDKKINELTAEINDILNTIMKEKNIPAIFNQDAIAVSSAEVVDITADVIKELK